MKVKPLFSDTNITIDNYLKTLGVDDIEEYINPKGYQIELFDHYNNHHRAYEVLIKHIKIQSKICLYADIDNDGVTSYTIMYRYIKELNPNIQIFTIFNKGKTHGITQDVMDCTIYNNCKLLIVPDAGSSDYDQHKILKEKNIDCLILDHHWCDYETPYAIVINNQLSKEVENKYACGASITYKFISYCEKKQGRKMGWKYIDLCACGLIGDIMSSIPIENRTYIHFGLQHITNPFLRYLYDKLINKDSISPKDILFSLVPKINATIREDNQEHKSLLLKCFAENLDEEIYQQMLDICLNAHKKQSQIVSLKYENILSSVDNSSKVIIELTDKSTYAGLLCSKLSDNFSKPTILITKKDNEYLGSVRSPVGIKEIFENSGVAKCMGHDCSCGIQISDLDKFKAYCNTLELDTEPFYEVAISLSSNQVSSLKMDLYSLTDDYKTLWNKGCNKPLFHVYNICINAKNIKVMGKNKTSIKWNCNDVDYFIPMISHNKQEKFYIGQNKNIDVEVIGEPSLNKWSNKITKQIIIDRFEVKNKKEIKIEDIF